MCKRKPGPRCFSHQYPKYIRALGAVNSFEIHRNNRIAAAGGIENLDPEERDTLKNLANDVYARKREASNQLYSTPAARKRLNQVELPAAQHRLARAQKQAKANPEDVSAKKELINAKANYSKYRNLIANGERRWSQSHNDLRTFNHRSAMMDKQADVSKRDYEKARFDNADLSRANEWDTLRGKERCIQRSDNHKMIRRRMAIETPTGERVSATSTVSVVGNKATGYKVHTRVNYKLGTVEQFQDGTASLPHWQNPRTRISRDNQDFNYTPEYTSTPVQSERFETFAEAQKNAEEQINGNSIPRELSRMARNKKVNEQAMADGIRSPEQYKAHQDSLRQVQKGQLDPRARMAVHQTV